MDLQTDFLPYVPVIDDFLASYHNEQKVVYEVVDDARKIVTNKLGAPVLGPAKSRLSYGDIFTDEKEGQGAIGLYPATAKKVSDSDVIKFFKSKYRAPKELYTVAKINRRNKTTYAVEINEDPFHDTYERRKQQLHQGFWSSNIHPYKTFGDVVLDAKELMRDNLKDVMKSDADIKAKDIAELFPDAAKKTPGAVSAVHMKDIEPTPSIINYYETESGTKMTLTQLRATKHAGRNFVKECLRDSEDRRRAVSCGQSYVDHVQRFQEWRTHRGQVSSSEQIGMKLSTASTGNPYCQCTLDADVTEKEAYQRMKDRTKRIFQKELEYIFMLLCSVRNIRSRDLGTKHPFPPQVVKLLRRDPFAKFEEMISKRNAAAVNKTDVRGQSRLPATDSRISQATVLGYRPKGKMSNWRVSTVNIGQEPNNMGPGSHRTSSPATSRVRSRMSSLHIGQSRRKLGLDSGTKVETWDDILALGSPDKVVAAPVNLKEPVNRWKRRRAQIVDGGGGNKKDSKKPIWGLIGEFQKEKNKVFVMLQQKVHTTLKAKRVNNMLSAVLSDVMTHNPLEINNIEYLKVKRRLANIAEKNIDNLTADFTDMFIDKYKAFEYIHSRLPFYEFMDLMHNLIHASNRERQLHKVSHLTGEPKWLEFLRMDVETTLGKCDKLEKRLKEISRVATAEMPWITPKVKTIVEDDELLEKLCILTMSFPAYEVCQLEMQMAFMWVMENFAPRGYNAELFLWWLDARKIPSWYPFDKILCVD